MKRKIVNLLLGTMVTAALAMTGCGEKKAEETAAVTESSESATVATEEVEEIKEEETEEVTEESTEAEAFFEDGKAYFNGKDGAEPD